MPLVEALRISCCSLPVGTPGAISPGAEMLAGVFTGWLGTVLPSGSVGFKVSAAVALVTARLAVQAPESNARGTRAVAFCHALMRRDVMMSLPCQPGRPPLGPGRSPRIITNGCGTVGLRLGNRKFPSAFRHRADTLPRSLGP